MSKYHYGARPSLPDQRNHKFLFMQQNSSSLPAAYSLKSHAQPVVDQEALGSCVSNSLANVFRYWLVKDNVSGEKFLPSRLLIYYDGRVIENTVNSDSGLAVTDGIKVLNANGACAEHQWPYSITRFTEEPPADARANATHRKAIKYEQIDNTQLNQVKGALTMGLPVTIGFVVYSSFESQEVATTGIVPMPASNEQTIGGHCVTIYGYDDATQRFTIQNSWGTIWGQEGWFEMPYAYVTNPNLCFDCWSVQVVSRVA